MANKKKARKVSTVFGNQKITTTPEVAKKIKSGEISPETHTFSQQNGSVNFAPKRRAVVGGAGIVPSIDSVQGVNSTPAANKASGGAVPSANPAGGAVPKSNKVPGTNKVPSSQGVPKTGVPSTNSAASKSNARTMAMPNFGTVPEIKVNDATPLQTLQMQEMQAQKVAPFKADLETVSAQLGEIGTILETASDEDLANIRVKLDALKGALAPQQ